MRTRVVWRRVLFGRAHLISVSSHINSSSQLGLAIEDTDFDDVCERVESAMNVISRYSAGLHFAS
jgi:hypothetical protein